MKLIEKQFLLETTKQLKMQECGETQLKTNN